MTPPNTPRPPSFQEDFLKFYGAPPVSTSMYPSISESVIRKEIDRLEELEKEAADNAQVEEAYAYAQCKAALHAILFA